LATTVRIVVEKNLAGTLRRNQVLQTPANPREEDSNGDD